MILKPVVSDKKAIVDISIFELYKYFISCNNPNAKLLKN